MAGFSTNECAWAQITFKLLGRTIVGIRGFEVDKEIEKEHLFAAGDEPIDIQSGNKKLTGNFKFLKYEVDLLNEAAQAAGFLDITEVPHTLISSSIVFRKTLTAPIKTLNVYSIAFTKMTFGMEQNGKLMEITMPYLAMRIELV